MAPAVAALRVADASSASAGTVANASAQTPIQAASRPMLLVDMEILWRGGREGISDAWRGKKLSGVVRPGSCGRWPLHENGPRALPFEGGVDRAPDRARAMHGSRRDHCRRPRDRGAQLAPTDVAHQPPPNHQEQPVRLRGLVPAVLALRSEERGIRKECLGT